MQTEFFRRWEWKFDRISDLRTNFIEIPVESPKNLAEFRICVRIPLRSQDPRDESRKNLAEFGIRARISSRSRDPRSKSWKNLAEFGIHAGISSRSQELILRKFRRISDPCANCLKVSEKFDCYETLAKSHLIDFDGENRLIFAQIHLRQICSSSSNQFGHGLFTNQVHLVIKLSPFGTRKSKLKSDLLRIFTC